MLMTSKSPVLQSQTNPLQASPIIQMSVISNSRILSKVTDHMLPGRPSRLVSNRHVLATAC